MTLTANSSENIFIKPKEEFMILIRNYHDLLFHNLSINIPWGLTGIMGPSGIGKSTLLRVIHTNKHNPSILCNFSSSAYMAQDHIFFPNLSIQDNLLLICPANISMEHFIERMHNLLQLLKLNHLNTTKIINYDCISGGEKQRLSLIRAILQDKELLILDEPTSALDAENITLFIQIIQDKKYCKNLLIVSHDSDLLEKICTTTINLQHKS